MWECGINEHVNMVTLNPRRIGPDLSDKIIIQPQVFEDFTLSHLRGIFLLYIFVVLLSFVLFALEISKFIHSLKVYRMVR